MRSQCPQYRPFAAKRIVAPVQGAAAEDVFDLKIGVVRSLRCVQDAVSREHTLLDLSWARNVT